MNRPRSILTMRPGGPNSCKRSSCRGRLTRGLGIEPLEDRYLLSVGGPPSALAMQPADPNLDRLDARRSIWTRILRARLPKLAQAPPQRLTSTLR